MKTFATEIVAISNETGELATFCGEHIQALTIGLAQQWCDENKGYLKVTGELIVEIPFNIDKGIVIEYGDTSLN